MATEEMTSEDVSVAILLIWNVIMHLDSLQYCRRVL